MDIPRPEQKENSPSEKERKKHLLPCSHQVHLSVGMPWISFPRGIQSHMQMDNFPGCSRHLRLQTGSLQVTWLCSQINTLFPNLSCTFRAPSATGLRPYLMSQGQIPVFLGQAELAQAGWEAPSCPALALLCVVIPCPTCSTWKTHPHLHPALLCSASPAYEVVQRSGELKAAARGNNPSQLHLT